jgi:hypothetical protein
MSLIGFHRVLITCGIIFCAGFSAWELVAFARQGRTSDLLVGLGFALASGALTVYLLFLRRILRLPGTETRRG